MHHAANKLLQKHKISIDLESNETILTLLLDFVSTNSFLWLFICHMLTSLLTLPVYRLIVNIKAALCKNQNTELKDTETSCGEEMQRHLNTQPD